LSPDSIPSEPTYNPTQLPTPHNSSLPPKLDPANSHDPLRLAKQLLALCPDPPKLSFVARLFLSFPAPSDQVEDGSEWADLTTLLDDYLPTQGWLEQVIHSLGKSILKETDITSIREFVERVRECVETVGPFVNVMYSTADDVLRLKARERGLYVVVRITGPCFEVTKLAGKGDIGSLFRRWMIYIPHAE
jgi:hypothetical protein